MKQPRYMEVAQELIEDIANGSPPLGQALPPERQLCERFAISRHTCREALRVLRDRGLIDTLQGSGTRVKQTSPRHRADGHFDNIDELLQYGRETRLELVSADWVQDQIVAGYLGLASEQALIRLTGFRHRKGEARALCRVRIFGVASATGNTGQSRDVRAWREWLIEALAVERVARVEQLITADLLTPRDAKSLHAEPGAPALVTTRRYFGLGQQPLAYAVSIHPADRFQMTTTLVRRTHG
jgi:DNA-binding GntR family transcriptional regulator